MVLENAVEFMSIEELDALEQDVESNNNLMGYDILESLSSPGKYWYSDQY